VFISVRLPSLELKSSSTTARGSTLTVGTTMAPGDTTAADMTTIVMMADMTTTAMGGMIMTNSTTTVTAGTTTLDIVGDGLSSGGKVAPSIPNSVVARARGPIAFLQERAAILSQCADEAAAFAREAVADAQDINNAHASIVAKHCKMLLQCAFGINPDGTVITNASTLPEKLKKYKNVKSVEQYNDMIHVITNWGDKAFLKEFSSDDPQASTIRKSRKSNTQGYNYIRDFEVEKAEIMDGSPKMILKHRNSGKIVSHMLNIFDVIQEAHCRQGHLKAEKTLANCLPMFYSPTYELCQLFVTDCFVCHEKHPNVSLTKGAKKPILSLEFRDCIQVDHIDMRVMRKRDIYGNMQRWIMTVKDHSTGLVYLCVLPQKKAIFVVAKLEKYFGFVGYPEIFHTGVYTITFLLIQ